MSVTSINAGAAEVVTFHRVFTGRVHLGVLGDGVGVADLAPGQARQLAAALIAAADAAERFVRSNAERATG